VKDYPIKLGSLLFTMVEPHRGHEVEYNRWYERDHFYAGCMIGPWQFAGRRFVATRDLKALRHSPDNAVTPDPTVGSYLALYWVLAGHHDDWNKWAVRQVRQLHADGRMFGERDHIHTLLYEYAWWHGDPDGVSPELALDHPYAGLATVFVDATDDRESLADALRADVLPSLPEGSLTVACTPLPLLIDAPGDVPRHEADDKRLLLLVFLRADPRTTWESSFAGLDEAVAATGAGRLVWSSPFIPTLVGKDTYTDQLW
jgi:hypothetical protein